MIQDIAPHQLHIGYEYLRAPRQEDYVAVMQNGEILTDPSGCVPTFAALGLTPCGEDRYLFMIDDTAYFMRENVPAPEGFSYVKPMTIRDASPRHRAFGSILAVNLCHYYHRNRFCSTCGQPLVAGEMERVLKCPACGRTVYPRISPAVIVAVVDGDRVVLTKYAGRAFKRYALIAGYCEVGERPEDTVRREVMEEVGLKVGRIDYYKSQPWPFSETMLLGFVAHLEGDDTIRMDENELSVAEWVDRADIPDDMAAESLTREMILAFRDGLIG